MDVRWLTADEQELEAAIEELDEDSRPTIERQGSRLSGVIFVALFAALIWGRIRYDLVSFAALLAGVVLGVVPVAEAFSGFGDDATIIVALVLVVIWLYGRRQGCGFLQLADFAAPLAPLGLAAGRLGNFIGGELWGRLSDVPWAMIFPESIEAGGRRSGALYQQYLSGALDEFARHPSQLYQAALEGLALFVILWAYSARPRPVGAVGGAFLLGYGVFRFIAECFREPDAHLGFVALDWITMGQILSLPMMLAGLLLMIWAYRRRT